IPNVLRTCRMPNLLVTHREGIRRERERSWPTAERERLPLEEPLRVRAETKRTAARQQESGCHSHGNSPAVFWIPAQPTSSPLNPPAISLCRGHLREPRLDSVPIDGWPAV